MMSEIKNIFDISGRAMAAQLVRLNTVASNLANAGTIASTKEEAFRALKPVFQTTYADQLKYSGVSTVGFVYRAAVDENEEMVEMVEASRQYQNNVEVISTIRALMMRTINMGK